LKKMQSKLIKTKDFLSKGDRITINVRACPAQAPLLVRRGWKAPTRQAFGKLFDALCVHDASSTRFRRGFPTRSAAPSQICGNTLTADPREFSGGGKGWYTGGKIEVSINGKPCWAQASINISVPGSKEWK